MHERRAQQHQPHKIKKKADNKFHVMATLHEFDPAVPLDNQSAFYDVWKTYEDFYQCAVEYYKNDKTVRCYKKGGKCDNDDE